MVRMMRGLSKFVFSNVGFLCLSFVLALAMKSCEEPDPVSNQVYDPFNQDGPGQPVKFKGNYTVATPVPTTVNLGGFGPGSKGTRLSGAREATGTTYLLRLLRQADCSMTEYLTGDDTDSGGFSVYSSTNVQNYLHTAAGLTTTPDVFANGCSDTMVGKSSEENVYAGRTSSGQVIAFQITEDNALEEAVIDLSSSTTTHAGTSTFTAYPSITYAVTMVTADLNGDGNQDLILTDAGLNGGTAGVKVLMGHGDGTFAAPVNYQVPGFPGALVVDDLNKDGKLDLVVSSEGSSTSATQLFPGNGDGTFGTPTLISNTFIATMATGDVDGDGNKDIVTSAGMVLKGKGDGTFVAATTILASGNFGFPVLGDFNHDGKLDAAFNQSGGGGVTVYTGNGDGTFTLGRSYTSIYGSQNISALDIDGDGNLDLVVGSGNSGALGPDQGTGGIWEVLMGNGDGTFQGSDLYPAINVRTESPNLFVFGDFNGDGSVDMLTDAQGTGLQVLLNNGKGRFTGGGLNTSSHPVALAAALMNGDKNLDAVVLDSNSTSSTSSVGVALGNGDGTFQAVKDYALPDQSGGIAVITGDFNGDGFPDVVATTAGEVYLYLNDGTGGLKAPSTVDSVQTNAANFSTGSALAVGDINGDGKLDLVVSNEGVGEVKVYLGRGDGTFGTPAVYQPDTASGVRTDAVALADLNGDGKLDLVFSTSENFFNNPLLNVYLGKGDGTFNAVVTTTLPQTGSGIAIADLNGDGKLDVLEGSCCGLAYAMVSYGNGDGTLTGAYQFANAVSIATVGVADLNGDGQADIVAGALEGGSSGGIEVFLNLFGTSAVSTTPIATTTMLTALPNPATVGQSVTLTATVTENGGSSVPTGAVTFLDGTTTLGTGALTAGVATFTTSGLSAGSHAITASYGGDTGDSTSVSAVLTEVVNVPVSVTTTALSAAPNPATVGENITFTAKVGDTSGTGVPTGTVTFMDGSAALGTGSLSGGIATFATSALMAGTHTVTAMYGGDAGDAASVSAAVTVTIVAAGSQGFTLSLNPASGTVGQAGMVSTTLTVTPMGGFNQAATFACSGLPNHSLCLFAPSVTTPDGAAVTTVMTIETGLAQASVLQPEGTGGLPGSGAAVAGVFGVGLMLLRRRARSLRTAVLGWSILGMLVAGVLAVGLTGCGNGGVAYRTSAGSDVVTVTATAGMVSHSATYTLTVQ